MACETHRNFAAIDIEFETGICREVGLVDLYGVLLFNRFPKTHAVPHQAKTRCFVSKDLAMLFYLGQVGGQVPVLKKRHTIISRVRQVSLKQNLDRLGH